jgi:hypothetical protein
MRRKVIVSCQVYKNNESKDKLLTPIDSGKLFRIELEKKYLLDEERLKEILKQMVSEKSNIDFTFEYFSHEVHNFEIDKLGTQKDFMEKNNEIWT